ncbi:hypothetical protein Hdeb2414_s0018g00527631 [Helianthus debilis subsp. tardiflorus]
MGKKPRKKEKRSRGTSPKQTPQLLKPYSKFHHSLLSCLLKTHLQSSEKEAERHLCSHNRKKDEGKQRTGF